MAAPILISALALSLTLLSASPAHAAGVGDVPMLAQAGCTDCAVVLSVRKVPVGSTRGKWVRQPAPDPIGNRIGTARRDPLGGDRFSPIRRKMQWEILLLTDKGNTVRVHQPYMPGFPAGSKVRIVSGRVVPR
ncbi:MAG: hypothetical protein R3E48_04225 [Burkholderiaceae bacterium]